MRDARILLIGGEPSLTYIRKAKNPILKDGKIIEYPPSKSRYLTNISQGGSREEIPKALREKCTKLAKETHKAILDSLKKGDKILEEEKLIKFKENHMNFGWGSVDLLFSEDEKIKVCEIHAAPDAFYPLKNPTVVCKLGNYLRKLSEGGVIGILYDPSLEQLFKYLDEDEYITLILFDI